MRALTFRQEKQACGMARTGSAHDLGGGPVEGQLPYRQTRVVQHLLIRRRSAGAPQQRRQQRHPAWNQRTSRLIGWPCAWT